MSKQNPTSMLHIKSVSEPVSFEIVEIPELDFPLFRRFSADVWEMQLGDEWYEAGCIKKETEAAYREYMAKTVREPSVEDVLLAALKQALGYETSKDCHPDHHGHCQAHNTEPIESCWVRVAEEAIARAEKAR